MFATNTFIDMVQESKKYFVNNFVTDSKLKLELNSFVDEQTKFTKQAIKTGETVIDSYVKQMNTMSK